MSEREPGADPGSRGGPGRLEGWNTRQFSVCCPCPETGVKQAVRVLSKLSFSCSARILKATLLFKQLRGLTFLMSDFRAEAPDMWLEALFP